MPQNITVTIAKIVLANRVTGAQLVFEPPILSLKERVEPENDEHLQRFLMSVVDDPRLYQGKWCLRIQVTPSTHAVQNYALNQRTLRSELHLQGEEVVYTKHAALLSNLYSAGCEKLHALLSAFIQDISERMTIEMVFVDLGVGSPVVPCYFTSKTDDPIVEMRLNSRPFMFTPLASSDETYANGIRWIDYKKKLKLTESQSIYDQILPYCSNKAGTLEHNKSLESVLKLGEIFLVILRSLNYLAEYLYDNAKVSMIDEVKKKSKKLSISLIPDHSQVETMRSIVKGSSSKSGPACLASVLKNMDKTSFNTILQFMITMIRLVNDDVEWFIQVNDYTDFHFKKIRTENKKHFEQEIVNLESAISFNVRRNPTVAEVTERPRAILEWLKNHRKAAFNGSDTDKHDYLTQAKYYIEFVATWRALKDLELTQFIKILESAISSKTIESALIYLASEENNEVCCAIDDLIFGRDSSDIIKYSAFNLENLPISAYRAFADKALELATYRQAYYLSKMTLESIAVSLGKYLPINQSEIIENRRGTLIQLRLHQQGSLFLLKVPPSENVLQSIQQLNTQLMQLVQHPVSGFFRANSTWREIHQRKQAAIEKQRKAILMILEEEGKIVANTEAVVSREKTHAKEISKQTQKTNSLQLQIQSHPISLDNANSRLSEPFLQLYDLLMTLSNKDQNDYLQYIADHWMIFTPSGIESSCIPIASPSSQNPEEWKIGSQMQLWRAQGNQQGSFYFNPWHFPLRQHQFKLNWKSSTETPLNLYGFYPSVIHSLESAKESVGDSLKRFIPVSNISCASLVDEAWRHPLEKTNAMLDRFEMTVDVLHKEITKIAGGFLTTTCLENTYLLHKREGIDRLQQLMAHEIGAALVPCYFSKFTQLDYFSDPDNFIATLQALDRLQVEFNSPINALSKKALFFKLMSNIGYSRQPLVKLIDNYFDFLSMINGLDREEQGLLDKIAAQDWCIPQSGNDPACIMDGLIFILQHAEKHQCLSRQVECLAGLEISGVRLMPIQTHNLKFIFEEFLPVSIKPIDLLKLGSEDLRKNLSETWSREYKGFFPGALSIVDVFAKPTYKLLQQAIQLPYDYFHYWARHAPNGLSKAVLQKYLSQSLEKDQLLLLIGLGHQVSTELMEDDVAMLLNIINSLGKKQALIDTLLATPHLRFRDFELMLAFMKTLKIFEGEQFVESLQFWIEVWQQDIQAAVVFYDINGPLFNENPPQLTKIAIKFARFRDLIALKDSRLANCSFYQKARLASLWEISGLKKENVSDLDNLFKQFTDDRFQWFMNYFIDEPRKFKLNLLEEITTQVDVCILEDLRREIPKISIAKRLFAMTSSVEFEQFLADFFERYPLLNGKSLYEILSLGQLDPSTKTSLYYAYYQYVVFKNLHGLLKNTLVPLFADVRMLLNSEQANALILQCKAIQELDYSDEERVELYQVMTQMLAQHETDRLQQLSAIFDLLLFYKESNCTALLVALKEESQLRFKYSIALKDKGYPLYRVMEFLERIKTFSAEELEKLDGLMKVLTPDNPQVVKTMIANPLFGVLINHPFIDLKQADSSALLGYLLGDYSHSLEVFLSKVKEIPEGEALFKKFSNAIACHLQHDNAHRLSSAIHFILMSQGLLKHENDFTTVIHYLLTQEERNLSKLFALYQWTTSSFERLEQVAKGQLKIDALIHDPRGDRLEKRENTSRQKLKAYVGALKVSRASSDSAKIIDVEMDYQWMSSREGIALYQGKTVSQLSPEKIQQIVAQIKNINLSPTLTVAEKVRVLLPLVEEALFYATGMRLKNTQRLSIMQAICCDTRVVLQEISTGEGKSLTDMLKCAMLSLVYGGKVEFTTSAMPDVERDLTFFKGFFKVLGLRVGNEVLSSASSLEDYHDADIIMSTPEELGLFLLNHSPMKEEVVHSVANEFDSSFWDRVNPLCLASPDILLENNPWIYHVFNRYYDKNSGLTSAVLAEKILQGQLQNELSSLIREMKFAESINKSDVVAQLTQEQLCELWLAAAFSKRLKLHDDYSVLRDAATGICHVHPHINKRAVVDINTHFSKGVHQCLCARINDTQVFGIPSQKVYMPLRTRMQSVANIQSLYLQRLQTNPLNRLLASSGTAIGSEAEQQWCAQQFGQDLTIAKIPEEERNQRQVFLPIICENQQDKQRQIAMHLLSQRIDGAHPRRPALIFGHNQEEADQYQQVLHLYLAKKDELQFQSYQGDTSKEREFVNSVSERDVSYDTGALGRNTDFPQKSHLQQLPPLNVTLALTPLETTIANDFVEITQHTNGDGLDVYITFPTSVRNNRQMAGRTGRNGAGGRVFYFYTREEWECMQASHALPVEDNLLYRYFTMLSLSKFWCTMRNSSLGILKAEAYLQQVEVAFNAEGAPVLEPEHLLLYQTSWTAKEIEDHQALLNLFYARERKKTPHQVIELTLQDVKPTDNLQVDKLLHTITKHPGLCEVLKSDQILSGKEFFQEWMEKPSIVQAQRFFMLQQMANPKLESDVFEVVANFVETNTSLVELFELINHQNFEALFDGESRLFQQSEANSALLKNALNKKLQQSLQQTPFEGSAHWLKIWIQLREKIFRNKPLLLEKCSGESALDAWINAKNIDSATCYFAIQKLENNTIESELFAEIAKRFETKPFDKLLALVKSSNFSVLFGRSSKVLAYSIKNRTILYKSLSVRLHQELQSEKFNAVDSQQIQALFSQLMNTEILCQGDIPQVFGIACNAEIVLKNWLIAKNSHAAECEYFIQKLGNNNIEKELFDYIVQQITTQKMEVLLSMLSNKNFLTMFDETSTVFLHQEDNVYKIKSAFDERLQVELSKTIPDKKVMDVFAACKNLSWVFKGNYFGKGPLTSWLSACSIENARVKFTIQNQLEDGLSNRMWLEIEAQFQNKSLKTLITMIHNRNFVALFNHENPIYKLDDLKKIIEERYRQELHKQPFDGEHIISLMKSLHANIFKEKPLVVIQTGEEALEAWFNSDSVESALHYFMIHRGMDNGLEEKLFTALMQRFRSWPLNDLVRMVSSSHFLSLFEGNAAFISKDKDARLHLLQKSFNDRLDNALMDVHFNSSEEIQTIFTKLKRTVFREKVLIKDASTGPAVLDAWLDPKADPESVACYFAMQKMDNPMLEANLFDALEQRCQTMATTEFIAMVNKPTFTALFEDTRLTADRVNLCKDRLKVAINQRVQQQLTKALPNDHLLDVIHKLQKKLYGPTRLLSSDTLLLIFDEYAKSKYWPVNAVRRQSLIKIKMAIQNQDIDLHQLLVQEYNHVLRADLLDQKNRWFTSLHRSGNSRFLNMMERLLPLASTMHTEQSMQTNFEKAPDNYSIRFLGGFGKVAQKYNAVSDREEQRMRRND